jgi:MoaA/NifB/PqqE/SkfB family radical SAM enzyme
MYLDWTDYCNAKCFFCPREKYEQQIGGKGGFIPFVKLKLLKNAFRKLKYFGISSGIGEPLLHPELDKILKWLYEINPTILIRTVTNGTALNAQKAAWVAGHLDWLSVSLNAANAQAHLRDMFPHLKKTGADAIKRWDYHIRRLTEFVAALPPDDRPRVRFQAVTHRHNVMDMVDFVRLVARMGGTHAVITPVNVHEETVDFSLYWVRDLYNDIVDEAVAEGAKLGVRVDAARFYTSVKPVLDLDQICQYPNDTAYVSKSGVADPCCQWLDAKIPCDVYSDTDGFERFWNDEIFRRLRKRRDFPSCQVCGLSRVFDEMSFHFTPKLKGQLISANRLSELEGKSDFPDAELIRVCIANRLDLPALRRSLLRLDVSTDKLEIIEEKGLDALPALERACWDAFRVSDSPAAPVDLALAGVFAGIGWGPPIYEAQNRVSARWIAAGNVASVFARVAPGTSYQIRLTIHHVAPAELSEHVKLAIGERLIETMRSVDSAGRATLSGRVPDDIVEANGGRLWLRIGCLDGAGRSVAGHMSMIGLTVSDIDVSAIESARAKRSPFVRAIIAAFEQRGGQAQESRMIN